MFLTFGTDYMAGFTWVSKNQNRRNPSDQSNQIYTIISQWELKVKTGKLLETQENAGDQFALIFLV